MYKEYKYKIKNIMKDINYEVISINHIGFKHSSAFLVECLNNKFIVKLKRISKNKNLLSRLLIDRLNKNYLNKEIEVYKILDKLEMNYFKVPELIYYRNDEFIIIEYIDPLERINPNSLGLDFVNALLEFNNTKIKPDFFRLKSSLFNINNNTALKILYLSSTKCFGVLRFNGWFKTLHIVLKSTVQQKRFENNFFVHRDLGLTLNNAFKSNNKIYFLDFESSVSENKWILQDIIDTAINKDLEFNYNIVLSYINRIDYDELMGVKINLPTQIRLCLTYRVLVQLSFRKYRSKEMVDKQRDFLNNILMDDGNFNKWLKENKLDM